MGKNQRHKKDLKAEKAKIKLKQAKTKFLPKGLNVTNTAFKVKPIVIPEQLKKKDVDEILSKRKLNVKDLLARIKHYNENVRHTACEELADIVQIFTEEVVQHLSSICLAVSSLMQDKERKVRKEAVKCIQTILKHVPHMKLVPFFNYFSTNLRCAMTNIDKNIQEDSLLFLDCFIQIDCGLIIKTSDKLLPDFLSLISKLRSDSQLGRTLTLNLGSKMTSVTWRIKVLSRLYAILKIILSREGLEKTGNDLKQDSIDSTSRQCFGLYKNKFGQSLEEGTLNIFSSNQASLVNRSINSFNQNIIALIPLLHETWLEVMPEEKARKTTENTDVNEETAALLSCIMNILYLLWKYIKKIENEAINLRSVFMTSESRKFFKHLLSNFPFSQSGARSKKRTEGNLIILGSNDDPKCIQENLLICYLYSVLFINSNYIIFKEEINAITSYITKFLFHTKSFKEENISCLIEFLKECFGGNLQRWQNSGMDLRIILENAVIFYECKKITHKDKLQLFRLLSSVLDKDYLSKSPKYQNWLSSLPNTLCQSSITDAVIFELLQLSKKNCANFHNALVKKLPNILDHLEQANVVYMDDSVLQKEDNVKRNIANIFYFLPKNTDLQVIEDYIHNGRLSKYQRNFEDMLKLRREFSRGKN